MFRNNQFLSTVSKLAQIQNFLVPKEPNPFTALSSIRFRWYDPNRVTFRRFGYNDKLAVRGLLPRPMKFRGEEDNEPEPCLPVPPYVPKNRWSEQKALFGQNDYIDLLGDGTIHPTEIMYAVPPWLRGFKGGEYQMLLRKRAIFGRAFNQTNPDKFHELRKNIKFCFKTLNRKRKVRYWPSK